MSSQPAAETVLNPDAPPSVEKFTPVEREELVLLDSDALEFSMVQPNAPVRVTLRGRISILDFKARAAFPSEKPMGKIGRASCRERV